MAATQSELARVNGLDMYYETVGRGGPLVLLHGALSTIETSFGLVLDSFAERHQVIAPEQQAHGRTRDVDRPLTYAQMADDTAALLGLLSIEGADLFGYSMGAGIALELAIRYPALVRRIAVASPAYSRDGFRPGVLDGIETANPDELAGSIFQEAYLEVAPDAAAWPTLIQKCNELDRTFQGWPPEAIASIKAPTLVIIGDSDIIRPEHAVQMFELLASGLQETNGSPTSQLAVLPGTTHLTLIERADWLVSMISAFLDATQREIK